MRARAIVAGLGQIGMGYDLGLDAGRVLTHARAFQQHPAFDLEAGVDPDRERRELFEQTFGRPTYATLDQALAKQGADIVAIAGPTETHAPVLLAAIEQAPLRAILCEKPIAGTIEQASAMVEGCAAKGVSLYVNYMRRSDPAVIEIKRRIEAGEIQTPLKGVAWYSKGFFHTGSHFVNLLTYWLGPIEGGRVLEAGRMWRNHDPEPDVRIEFKHGVVVFLAAREEHFSHYTVELIAPNGRLRYQSGGAQVEWQVAEADAMFAGYTTLSRRIETIPSGMARSQWNVVDQIARALAGHGSHLASGRDAWTTLAGMHKTIEGTW